MSPMEHLVSEPKSIAISLKPFTLVNTTQAFVLSIAWLVIRFLIPWCKIAGILFAFTAACNFVIKTSPTGNLTVTGSPTGTVTSNVSTSTLFSLVKFFTSSALSPVTAILTTATGLTSKVRQVSAKSLPDGLTVICVVGTT